MWWRLLAVLTVMCVSSVGQAVALSGSTADLMDADAPCVHGDVVVVAARGSGEERSYVVEPGDDPDLANSGRYGAAIYRELRDRLSPLQVELVSVDYPAVPLPTTPAAYGDSVRLGKSAAIDAFTSIAEAPGCSGVAVVAVGFSQGAHAVQWALDELRTVSAVVDTIASVGLFASPMFTHEDVAARGTFERAATGVSGLLSGLGGLQPLGPDYSTTGRTWCLAGDVVCDARSENLNDFSVHTGNGYGVNQDAEVTGEGTAAADIVNTIVWSLGSRGLIPTDPRPSSVLNGPPLVERYALQVAGNRYDVSLWVSAAPLAGSTQPLTSYAWDLDGDGNYGDGNGRPIATIDATRTDTGNVDDTHIDFGVRVRGPSGTERIYRLCWDAESDRFCAGTPQNPFWDDDESIFEADIEWMAAQGITRGCNPPVNDRFCPDESVTRGQMAAFLVRALDLPAAPSARFEDTVGTTFEKDIDRLAAAGITKGCNPPASDRFCPDDTVRREVMAAFLVRALGYTDDGGGDLFIDDDDSIFEGDIDRLATAGVTRGCNPPDNDRFCPTEKVTRGQLAAFLRRALG